MVVVVMERFGGQGGKSLLFSRSVRLGQARRKHESNQRACFHRIECVTRTSETKEGWGRSSLSGEPVAPGPDAAHNLVCLVSLVLVKARGA